VHVIEGISVNLKAQYVAVPDDDAAENAENVRTYFNIIMYKPAYVNL